MPPNRTKSNRACSDSQCSERGVRPVSWGGGSSARFSPHSLCRWRDPGRDPHHHSGRRRRGGRKGSPRREPRPLGLRRGRHFEFTLPRASGKQGPRLLASVAGIPRTVATAAMPSPSPRAADPRPSMGRHRREQTLFFTQTRCRSPTEQSL